MGEERRTALPSQAPSPGRELEVRRLRGRCVAGQVPGLNTGNAPFLGLPGQGRVDCFLLGILWGLEPMIAIRIKWPKDCDKLVVETEFSR